GHGVIRIQGDGLLQRHQGFVVVFAIVLDPPDVIVGAGDGFHRHRFLVRFHGVVILFSLVSLVADGVVLFRGEASARRSGWRRACWWAARRAPHGRAAAARSARGGRT